AQTFPLRRPPPRAGCWCAHLRASRRALVGSGGRRAEAGGGAGGRAGGCAGGQTVLLESLDADAPPLASVAPARGRLFLFPHDCPHKAEPVLRPPKLLLRGEMR
ncbi:unnamed protein product, partial [Prorocentrum cordatum]